MKRLVYATPRIETISSERVLEMVGPVQGYGYVGNPGHPSGMIDTAVGGSPNPGMPR